MNLFLSDEGPTLEMLDLSVSEYFNHWLVKFVIFLHKSNLLFLIGVTEGYGFNSPLGL